MIYFKGIIECQDICTVLAIQKFYKCKVKAIDIDLYYTEIELEPNFFPRYYTIMADMEDVWEWQQFVETAPMNLSVSVEVRMIGLIWRPDTKQSMVDTVPARIDSNGVYIHWNWRREFLETVQDFLFYSNLGKEL